MKAELSKDGKTLTVTLPVNEELPRSKTGKTRIVASSGGNIPTAAIVDGYPVKIGVNAFIPLA